MIVECDGLNHDSILETHEFFIRFLNFTSLNMHTTKWFLHFCHDKSNEKNLFRSQKSWRIRIRKLWNFRKTTNTEAKLETNFTTQTPLPWLYTKFVKSCKGINCSDLMILIWFDTSKVHSVVILLYKKMDGHIQIFPGQRLMWLSQ